MEKACRERPRARSMGDDGLVEAITSPGCPMCVHVAGVAPHHLDSLLYQHTTDRAYRDRFLAGGGFCGRHVRAAVVADTAGNGDGVGGGIFLRSQLAARRRALQGAGGFRAAKRIREATRTAWDCPVCENERALAQAAARRLVDLTRSDATWRVWVTSAPWCLAHLGDVLAAAAEAGGGTLAELRDHQLAQMADIEGRLEALAHDSAHGRREAVTPEVRASVREAADILAGDA
ncbi:MAG: hypothetical protein AB1Z67_14375 [Candidatus Limnocylindrales bacterium]